MQTLRLTLSFALAGACLFASAERIVLKTENSSCAIETVGARVLSFVGPDGGEALWNADPLQTDDPKWAHGGIPVCWPWFGVNGKVDIHGTAWRKPFAVVSREERKDRAELVLARDEGGIRLEYTLVLRDTLKLALKTVNRGKADFSFTAGFHPYFRVGERDGTSVGGVTERPIPMTRAIDDIFPTQPGSCSVYRLHDPSLGRTVYTFFENATDVNIWNPGPQKDCPGTIPGDEWRRFVCVEPIARGPVTLKPGEHHTVMLGIDVRRGAAASGYIGADPRRPQAAEQPTGRPFHIVYLGAHPDDFDFDFAPQAVRLVRAGAKVTAVSFCNGNKGHAEMAPAALAARRLREAQAAAEVYGLERYIVLGAPDCELEATRAWRERAGRLVRDLAPDMIITHRTVDYHADHRAVGQIVRDLAYFLGVPHWCPDTPVPGHLPFILYAVDGFTVPRPVRADLLLSGEGALAEGARGLACHVSQLFEWLPPEEGVDPAALATPAARAAYTLAELKNWFGTRSKPYADVLEKAYGRRDEPALVTELSEYSRPPSAREISVLNALPGVRWVRR